MPQLIYDGLFTGLIITIIAYLLGSLSSAVIVCRLLGLPDPRESGSKNPGATNVLRLGGKKPAALTLIGDMLKGLLATVLASVLGMNLFWVALAGLGAVLGHLFPVFFGFRGGKGVATGLGAILGTHWITGLLALSFWLATCLVFRISSLAALVTFAAIPLLLLVSGKTPAAWIFLVVSALLYWRHQENIKRLITGKEPRVNEKSTDKSAPNNTTAGV